MELPRGLLRNELEAGAAQTVCLQLAASFSKLSSMKVVFWMRASLA
ncbi:MAG: hypothetical protein RL514_2195 [Verrucomicrobiota bacterium]|jgi:hypothetical protein